MSAVSVHTRSTASGCVISKGSGGASGGGGMVNIGLVQRRMLCQPSWLGCQRRSVHIEPRDIEILLTRQEADRRFDRAGLTLAAIGDPTQHEKRQ